ncbi:superoxide dismutase family protein [Microtetraspora sp. AC03309]|uniref:superoxide dismutase family protein n=1 Tax=Microtetraspora sp. AC03309 TaxID=2779376 RepID=UPI001E5F9699|nr:superoxide dismutase family protein [Microtetraspora sp. AC03309]MCC5580282.1 superoxide dismutase family protein [Microtetraspora sp. AC03309]
MKTLKTTTCALVVAGVALSTVASASADSGPEHGRHKRTVLARGTFVSPATARNAFTYEPATVPAGARAKVFAAYPSNGKTTVRLAVHGLLPNRKYGAHVHVNPCGATGSAAGGHFQHEPSADPSAANPANEIWLDFTTDRRGNGSAYAVQNWQFDSRRPGSVVIHEQHTSHGDPPPPGSAGARLACLTVPF